MAPADLAAFSIFVSHMPQLPETWKVSVFVFCANDIVATEQHRRIVENILSVCICLSLKV